MEEDESEDDGRPRGYVKAGAERKLTTVDAAVSIIPTAIDKALNHCRRNNPNIVVDRNSFEETDLDEIPIIAFVIENVALGGTILEGFIRESLGNPGKLAFTYKLDEARCIVTWDKREFLNWWAPRNPTPSLPYDFGMGVGPPPAATSGVATWLAGFGQRCLVSTTGKMACYLACALIPLTWYTFVKCHPSEWDRAGEFYSGIGAFFTQPN